MTSSTKVLIVFMINSLAIPLSSAETPTKSLPQNRIFSEDNILDEKHLSHRPHPYGGTLVWGVVHEPTIINPILTQSSVSATLIGLIFDSLVRIDRKSNVVPGLAKAWDISKDGLVYTFYLHKEVSFHDGVELTAEDVKFTYELILDPSINCAYRSHFKLVDRLEVIDKYTFRVTLKKPFLPFIYKMVRYIMPKHLLIKEDIHKTAFNYHPVGTGSFEFDNWNKETNEIKLTANPHYFEGRPYLNKVTIKTYPDIAQLWAAFMRREVNLVQWISIEDYSIVKNDPAFKVHAIPSDMYYAIVYNVKDSIWQDRDLRQAVAYAINTKDITSAFPGFDGEECTGPFHPKSTGYNQDVKPFAYDPVKAKLMLMHRGWQDVGTDVHDGENSIRTKGGRELELRILVDERSDIYKKMAKIIRQQLSEIGIKVVVLFYNDESELTEEYLDTHKPQAWLRLFSGLGDSADAALSTWYSLSTKIGKFGGYRNKHVDALFESAREMQDHSEQAETYKDIHKIIYDDQPACFLFFPSFYFAVTSDFKNTDEYFSFNVPTYTIKNWYVSEN